VAHEVAEILEIRRTHAQGNTGKTRSGPRAKARRSPMTSDVRELERAPEQADDPQPGGRSCCFVDYSGWRMGWRLAPANPSWLDLGRQASERRHRQGAKRPTRFSKDELTAIPARRRIDRPRQTRRTTTNVRDMPSTSTNTGDNSARRRCKIEPCRPADARRRARDVGSRTAPRTSRPAGKIPTLPYPFSVGRLLHLPRAAPNHLLVDDRNRLQRMGIRNRADGPSTASDQDARLGSPTGRRAERHASTRRGRTGRSHRGAAVPSSMGRAEFRIGTRRVPRRHHLGRRTLTSDRQVRTCRPARARKNPGATWDQPLDRHPRQRVSQKKSCRHRCRAGEVGRRRGSHLRKHRWSRHIPHQAPTILRDPELARR